MVEILSTDVLVIGGGAAGANAALKAADQGAKVTQVVKGLLGKSGCSIFASHLPFHDASSKNKNEDRLRYSVRYYNHYLTDQEYCVRMGKYMRSEFYDELERLGVYWLRDDDGRVIASPSRTPTAVVHKQGATGIIIMDKRRREVFSRDIPVFEECAVTSLLVDDKRVVGATMLDIRSGRFFVIQAKAVILATGHSDYLATRATGTREQSADGIAMALRTGAELANMEIQWWHISDLLEPKAWMRMHLYPNPLLGTTETSRLYNKNNKMFFEQITHNPGSSAPYVDQIRRLAREVEAGNARWDGDYYHGYDHIPAETIKAYQHQAKVWSKLGLDVGKDRLECGITMHMRQGGVNVDPETMKTSINGLYAIGGLACHYLGGVGPVSFDGKIAGTHAAHTALEMPETLVPKDQINREKERVFGFLREGSSGPRPIDIKIRIREIMWQLGYVKNKANMTEALDALVAAREDLVPKVRLQSTALRWNTGWMDAIDACSMLDACEATLRSGMLREESRGPFYREDFPYVDNENWLCKLILQRSEGNWISRTEPYDLPYLKPEKTREPFFETDY